MQMLAQGVAWYLLIAAGGVAGLAMLQRWGVGSGAAWAVGRVVAWTIAAYGAWLAGCVGVSQWWWVAIALCAVLAVLVRPRLRRLDWASLGEAEAIGMAAFLVLAILRLPMMEVTGTEKPMDLSVLATLLRPGVFPPSDPWLAGETLPYYFWGFMPWVPAARALGLAPDVAFNLLVPTIAAVTAQGAWALARALGGSRRSAILASMLVVFAGTPDGWRQLASTASLRSMDLWHSSRCIAGTITEFPLFTFHLGDLHPHVLVLPLLLTSIFLACGLSLKARAGRAPVVLVALLYGAAAAANPWSALPLGVAVLMAAVATEARFFSLRGEGVTVWLRVTLVGLGGVVLFLPFWLSYQQPRMGLGWVSTATRWDELGLFLGGVLIPPLVVAWALAWRWGGLDAARRQLARALWVAAMVIGAALTGRLALSLAVVLGLVLAVGAFRGTRRRARPAWAMTLVPLALIAAMEVVYVRDPYGGELYRMNTVFKLSHVAFTLLAITAPLLLSWLRRRRPVVATVAAVAVILSGLPHFGALALRVTGPPGAGWSGLNWMAPGEAEAARWLHRLPPGSVLVEGVGDAYSDAARLSAASGVPTVLGWENHERVWRWGSDESVLHVRKAKVEEIYRCGDADRVREQARDLGATHIAIGAVERRLYPPAGLPAVRDAGTEVFSAGGCTIVELDD